MNVERQNSVIATIVVLWMAFPAIAAIFGPPVPPFWFGAWLIGFGVVIAAWIWAVIRDSWLDRRSGAARAVGRAVFTLLLGVLGIGGSFYFTACIQNMFR